MKTSRLLFLYLLLVLFLMGCVGGAINKSPTVSGRTNDKNPVSDDLERAETDFFQEGQASWYGGKFHGRRTASGEVYDKWDLTAAHRTLPLGTKLLVEHIGNGRRIKVKVNDRGPFVENRVIDLSRGAAAQLNMIREGVADVRLYRIVSSDQKEKVEQNQGHYTIQVGSFRRKTNATEVKKDLLEHFDEVRIIQDYKDFYRVRVGTYDERSKTSQSSRILEDLGYSTWIVRNDS